MLSTDPAAATGESPDVSVPLATSDAPVAIDDDDTRAEGVPGPAAPVVDDPVGGTRDPPKPPIDRGTATPDPTTAADRPPPPAKRARREAGDAAAEYRALLDACHARILRRDTHGPEFAALQSRLYVAARAARAAPRAAGAAVAPPPAADAEGEDGEEEEDSDYEEAEGTDGDEEEEGGDDASTTDEDAASTADEDAASTADEDAASTADGDAAE